jgi:hypothetical protein
VSCLQINDNCKHILIISDDSPAGRTRTLYTLTWSRCCLQREDDAPLDQSRWFSTPPHRHPFCEDPFF